MITSNLIKTKGIKAIVDGLKKEDRLSISVGGRIRYVVLKVDDYKALRLAELEMTYQEIVTDVEKGKYKEETAEQHLNRLWSN